MTKAEALAAYDRKPGVGITIRNHLADPPARVGDISPVPRNQMNMKVVDTSPGGLTVVDTDRVAIGTEILVND